MSPISAPNQPDVHLHVPVSRGLASPPAASLDAAESARGTIRTRRFTAQPQIPLRAVAGTRGDLQVNV